VTSKLIEELRAGIRRDLYSLSGGDVMYLIDHAAPQEKTEGFRALIGQGEQPPEGGSLRGESSAVAAPFLNWLWEKTPQTMQVLWETFLEEQSDNATSNPAEQKRLGSNRR
jgi:hypothetical protein